MAFTDKYVSSDGSGDGSDSDHPMSWATLASATWMTAGGTGIAGTRFFIKAGSYSLSADDTWTSDGTANNPIAIIGCDSSWNPITPSRTNGSGALITTSYPVLTYASGKKFNGGGSNYTIYRALKVVIDGTGVSSAAFSTGNYCIVEACSITNPSTNDAAIGITSPSSLVINNDVTMSGTSGTVKGINASASRIEANHVKILSTNDAAYHIYSATSPTSIEDNLCYGGTAGSQAGGGIYYASSTTASYVMIRGNTVTGSAGSGIKVANYAYSVPFCIVNNHITTCVGYAIDSEYNATADLPAYLGFNRLRDNTAGAVRGFGNWQVGTSTGHVTTDTGGDETDFNSVASDDFRLISAAPGKSTGLPAYADIGACQRPEPTYPSASHVWHTAAAYGDVMSPTTPTKVASTITNCEAANVKNGVTIDDVTGTYAGGAEVSGPLLDRAPYLGDIVADGVIYYPWTALGKST